MAHHRLGHADEARQWSDKATRRIDEMLTGDGKASAAGAAGPPMPWNRKLTLRLLRDEAEALLASGPEP
jgi:hypothetical protein